MSCDPAGLVDLDRYPLLSPDSPRLQEVIAAAQAQLKSRGAAELTAFLSQLGLAAAVADANALGAIAYRGEGYGTVYLEPGSGELPEDHPRRWVGRAAVSVVAYDQFPPASPLRRLYEWQPLMQFIGDILERGPLYRYADPLGALNLAVMGDGDELQWHFDQTDFVVSLALQDGERGGDFEVVPFLRTADDENYDEVKRVVSGTSDAVVTLPMTPGTLLVFEGRNSVHRVSRISGATQRLVALLAYDTKPGTCSSPLLQMARYGRTARV